MASVQTEITVLIVEDNAGFALAVKSGLSSTPKFGTRIRIAASLQQALEEIESDSFDVVLLDLALPDSFGLETVLAVRRRRKNLPIIVLTGNDDEAMALEALKSGAQDYMLKGDLDGRSLATAVLYSIERMRTQEELRALTEQRDDFMAVISHGLKNNLIGETRILQSFLDGQLGRLSEEQLRYISMLANANDEDLRMANDLLRLYQYQTGAELLRFDEVDLLQIVQRCVRDMAKFADSRAIQICIGPCQPLSVCGDSGAIAHVISNLLHNAIKFSPVQGAVEVTLQSIGNMVAVKVKDDGEGIPASEQSRLFRKFSQGRLGKQFIGGTGLGLYLSYQIMQKHRGQLTYSSEPGSGTTFSMTLPASVDSN